MREIKFRGKNIYNGKFVYGFYLAHNNIHAILKDFGGIYYEIDPSTVGQYTGLKDPKGKEIYGAIGEKGGDVVYIAGQGNIYISCFPFYELYEKIFCGEGDDIGEVIGNAIENPELLNQNKTK